MSASCCRNAVGSRYDPALSSAGMNRRALAHLFTSRFDVILPRMRICENARARPLQRRPASCLSDPGETPGQRTIARRSSYFSTNHGARQYKRSTFDVQRGSVPAAAGKSEGRHCSKNGRRDCLPPKSSNWQISARLIIGEVLQMIRRCSAIPQDGVARPDNPRIPAVGTLHVHRANTGTPPYPVRPACRRHRRQSRRPRTRPPPNDGAARIRAADEGSWQRQEPHPEFPTSRFSCAYITGWRRRVKGEVDSAGFYWRTGLSGGRRSLPRARERGHAGTRGRLSSSRAEDFCQFSARS